MNTWMRHTGDSWFHAIAVVHFAGSTVTRCDGRWPSSDNHAKDDGVPRVEESAKPPHEERCHACTKALVDAGMIERGLRELGAFDLTDVDHELGGES